MENSNRETIEIDREKGDREKQKQTDRKISEVFLFVCLFLVKDERQREITFV